LDNIAKLIDGFRRFRAAHFEEKKQLFQELVTKGQSPKVMVVACSDSRVDPAIITGAEPGDLFVVRNVANLVPPYEPDGTYHGTSAALEFAVRFLGVEDIIVLGHAKCGGIHALMEGARVPQSDRPAEFIAQWMAIAERARGEAVAEASASREEGLRALEQAAITVSLENLRTFPWIESRLQDGRLRLHGWYFDIRSGELRALDQQSGRFEPLT
jgi:carbonic anhydrase